MGWFWADQEQPTKRPFPPANHPTPPPSCPMHNSPEYETNPLNLTFASLPQTLSPGQRRPLPTAREMSSIPRGNASQGNWEYPSPQQMYNAMQRKGHDDTPEDAVESMVAVHNFLNEGAWGEIVVWERRFTRRVEGGVAEEAEAAGFPRLVRFQGRSKDLTPKARVFQILGRVYPEKFGSPPPFDRHDWYVLRQDGNEVRYVIDYYSAPPEPTGEPVFYLDVRPAIDRPSAMLVRASAMLESAMVWGEDFWERASGADVRRAAQAAARRERDS